MTRCCGYGQDAETPEGPWSGPNMPAWNEARVVAEARYPNIALYDWAAIVRDSWFEPDGIHYTSACSITAPA